MKRIIFIIILIVLPSAGIAAEIEQPNWSVEVKGGLFVPDIENWSANYGGRDTGEYGGSVA